MADSIFKLLNKGERSFRRHTYKKIDGKRALIRIEYKAVNAYTYKVSHSRDLRKKHTKSD